LASRIRRSRWNRSSFSVVDHQDAHTVALDITVVLDIIAIAVPHIVLVVVASAFAIAIALPFVDSFAFIVEFVPHPFHPYPCLHPCRPSFVGLPCLDLPYLGLPYLGQHFLVVAVQQQLIRHSSCFFIVKFKNLLDYKTLLKLL
jgi:hypothetical protein